ncbi:FIST sensor-containing signal transduction protein [Malaciobacter marinus]|uniref:FIST sensor-containing signal transduction protein n=1 Tax=Malaciobacter marinus TaxID=505249 RepID=A0A347TJP5_9BACT|nr:FIST C-terminal domain-containing protein [Malaciobacter marinus]AXX86823.1 FIST sensor-containing signal transduction protein [Malaciobacter marinus]PHO14781.1 hypothetical protein CPH92_10130 [Malaciobacter marinus]
MSINVKYYKSLDAFVRDCKDENNRYLLLVAQECKFYMSLLKNSKIQAYGAIFPEIMFEAVNYKDGLLAYKLDDDEKIIIQNDISKTYFEKDEFKQIKSVITFVDGLSHHIDEFLDTFFELLEPQTQVLGGGAGMTPFNRKEVIFSPEGIYKDAALLLCKKQEINIGVEHGWTILKDQLVTTLVNETSILQIDYNNALDYYKKVIEEDLNIQINDINDYLNSYPIGLVKFDNEILVKEIFDVSNDSLNISNSISQNSVIAILKGNKDKLINAAKQATLEAVSKSENKQSLVLVFECVSRKSFLKESFEDEMQMIKKTSDNRLMLGVLTLGEIVNKGDVNLNLFNKTCLVGAIC